MGALANVHIACMGLEKIIPKREHLGVFFVFLQEVQGRSLLLHIPVISESQEKDRKCIW
jgi:L-lactate utilization protein LutB